MIDLWVEFAKALFILFPAYAANGFPPLARGKIPIDLKKKWLYLYGETGNGKTYTSVIGAIFTLLQMKSVAFYTEDELMFILRYDRDKAPDVLNECKKSDLFILDDFGKDKSSDFANTMLFSILNYRERCNKKTIVTSNELTDYKTCEEHLKPLASRIEANSIIKCFTMKIRNLKQVMPPEEKKAGPWDIRAG